MQKKPKDLDVLYRSILQKRTKKELIDDLCSLMSTYGLHMIEETEKRKAGGDKASLRYKDKKDTFADAFNKLRMKGKFSLKSLRLYLEENHPDPDPDPKLDTYWYRSGTKTWYAKLKKGETL